MASVGLNTAMVSTSLYNRVAGMTATRYREEGNEYNVITMSKYPSWEAIDKGAGWSAAAKIVQPDDAKRKKVNAAFNWVFEGSVHVDNIYSEATHTSDK